MFNFKPTAEFYLGEPFGTEGHIQDNAVYTNGTNQAFQVPITMLASPRPNMASTIERGTSYQRIEGRTQVDVGIIIQGQGTPLTG